MTTSREWINYFKENQIKKRIDWTLSPEISSTERVKIIRSLQAWQLGETSDGANLIRASQSYAAQIKDDDYLDAVKLFIKEEQKHGENLGKYLDAIGEKRLNKDWGDYLFRKVRYLNTSMEIWTVTVIIVESFAQLYYRAIANATSCRLLNQICKDILIDEKQHIVFQLQRLSIITAKRPVLFLGLTLLVYTAFFHVVFIAIWIGHGKAFKAGGVSLKNLYSKSYLKLRSITNKIALWHKEQRFQKTNITLLLK